MVRVKICGITSVEQGLVIAQHNPYALGYICTTKSPRYISPEKIAAITPAVIAEKPDVKHFGVLVNESVARMVAIARTANLTTLQLHGDETPATCQLLRDALANASLSNVQLVKAFRIRTSADLEETQKYESYVDMLLLDAYHPDQLGGTGETLDWETLKAFSPQLPWFLAGGLNPDNVGTALSQLSPDGIDLSSGVERSPGDKDLAKVQALFMALTNQVSSIP
ncbi:MAG: phosphoribosylanthranilate isomerase [Cyanobacteria bacterium J06649_4]